MASFGWSALNSLLGRGKQAKRWLPPEASWSRPFGLGWDKPYSVRYASNLDDGPNHGMPLGGFGAGCFGRAPDGNINLSGTSMAASTGLGCCPIVSSLCLKGMAAASAPTPWRFSRIRMPRGRRLASR